MKNLAINTAAAQKSLSSTTASVKPLTNAAGDKPIHGGRVFEAAAKLNINWRDIIDFSANINPLGQPKGLKKALFEDFDRTLHYPEVLAESLLERLAELTGLSRDHFLAGAGSTPHLHLLPRALNFQRPIIIGPAFAEYEGSLLRSGLRPQYVNARASDDWELQNDIFDRVFDRQPGVIYLANPANPTGRLAPGELVMELAERCQKEEVWLVVDEAFIDFTENGRSLLTFVKRNPRLIVLRSLTKIFALPGLRLAFLAAHPRVIDKLKALTEPWALSNPAITAGLYCLSCTGFKDSTLKALKIFKRNMLKGLNDINIGTVFTSDANFMLMKLRDIFKPRDLIEFLYQDGILIRDAANFNGLKSGFIRLAVRPLNETGVLLDAMGRFIGR